ncbi:unnamed protein product, partial [Iphiclides podalirius]
MSSSRKVLWLCALALFIFIAQIQSKPLDETNESALQNSRAQDEEMMDTAESQNPFLPRFAMKKLKERREKARAQRRQNQAARRTQPSPSQSNCPQRRYYRK